MDTTLQRQRPEVTIGWAALLVIDRHRCGPATCCPPDGPDGGADRPARCRRLADARLDLARLGLPHPQH